MSPSGKTKNFQLALSDFNAISVSQNIELQIAQSDKYSVVVETDEAAEDYLNFIIKDQTLQIGYMNNVKSINGIKTTVYITLPDLVKLSVSSSASVTGEGTFSGNSLDLMSSSSGKIDLSLNYSFLNVSASSSSVINVRGKANISSFSASSSSRINITNSFETDRVQISASSSSIVSADSVSCAVISAKASSSSRITIAGEGDSGVFTASSSSKVEATNFELYTAEAAASSSSIINVNVSSSLQAKASSSGVIYVFGEPLSINKTTSSNGMVTEKK